MIIFKVLASRFSDLRVIFPRRLGRCALGEALAADRAPGRHRVCRRRGARLLHEADRGQPHLPGGGPGPALSGRALRARAGGSAERRLADSRTRLRRRRRAETAKLNAHWLFDVRGRRSSSRRASPRGTVTLPGSKLQLCTERPSSMPSTSGHGIFSLGQFLEVITPRKAPWGPHNYNSVANMAWTRDRLHICTTLHAAVLHRPNTVRCVLPTTHHMPTCYLLHTTITSLYQCTRYHVHNMTLPCCYDCYSTVTGLFCTTLLRCVVLTHVLAYSSSPPSPPPYASPCTPQSRPFSGPLGKKGGLRSVRRLQHRPPRCYRRLRLGPMGCSHFCRMSDRGTLGAPQRALGCLWGV